MSFSDELRNAKEVLSNTQNEQRQQEWNDFKPVILEYVKSSCKYCAEKGRNNYYFSSDGFADFMDSTRASVCTSSNLDRSFPSDGDYSLYNHLLDIEELDTFEYKDYWFVEFDGSYNSSQWRTVRNRFFHYFVENKREDGEYYYLHPNCHGMSKKDAQDLISYLKQQLEPEGLKVDLNIEEGFTRAQYGNGLERYEGVRRVYEKCIDLEQMFRISGSITW